MLRHGATYAGHPSACAAALAVIDIYEREDLIRARPRLEQPLYDALAPLADHPAVRARSAAGSGSWRRSAVHGAGGASRRWPRARARRACSCGRCWAASRFRRR